PVANNYACIRQHPEHDCVRLALHWEAGPNEPQWRRRSELLQEMADPHFMVHAHHPIPRKTMAIMRVMGANTAQEIECVRRRACPARAALSLCRWWWRCWWRCCCCCCCCCLRARSAMRPALGAARVSDTVELRALRLLRALLLQAISTYDDVSRIEDDTQRLAAMNETTPYLVRGALHARLQERRALAAALQRV
ncbi:MAG: hypothetical protein ACK41Y_16630, partial [Paracoccus hibiscisoli]|uniref:hypothetical protein n=1 Tax=Paracoccus hibiscisoli TaxID=2023261 RepID=UPI00391D0F03